MYCRVTYRYKWCNNPHCKVSKQISIYWWTYRVVLSGGSVLSINILCITFYYLFPTLHTVPFTLLWNEFLKTPLHDNFLVLTLFADRLLIRLNLFPFDNQSMRQIVYSGVSHVIWCSFACHLFVACCWHCCFSWHNDFASPHFAICLSVIRLACVFFVFVCS